MILAKVGQTVGRRTARDAEPGPALPGANPPWRHRLLATPGRFDPPAFWLRCALLAALAVWGVRLIAMDHRSGEIGSSFLHGPLLVFHEAGHVLFRPGGEWLSVLGGTLGQLLMPGVIVAAFLLKNRDPFGAAAGLWLLGVSLLDVAPYVHDALAPKLVLLSGETGEAGGHDWIYLLSSVGLLARAPLLGAFCHRLGALVMLVALGLAAALLWRQWRQRQ
ncbi:MAG: hypothetical protein JNL87_14245 [Burkholderiaceae bacterium]|nr:hypothetical protein [Burkholderiaceae bacterium]